MMVVHVFSCVTFPSSCVPVQFLVHVGCDNETAAASFRSITYQMDGTRSVTQNHLGTNLSTQYLDLQGLSHKQASDFDHFHQLYPNKPTMATECCSCMSQRGEDADLTPADQTAANATRPGVSSVMLSTQLQYQSNLLITAVLQQLDPRVYCQSSHHHRQSRVC
jgi:hypothetical protein